MAMVIKNNRSANNTLNTLKKNSRALGKSLAKISSGMRINSAADDASGYAISERMRVQLRSLDQAEANTETAGSLMKVAEGALQSSIDILRTLKEKAINAANDTNTDTDRATIQKEADQLIDQLDDNSLVTYNGKYIFDGSADKSFSNEQTVVQALHSEWIGNSLELIEQSTGLNFTKSNGIKEMSVILKDEGTSGTLAYVSSVIRGDKTTALSLTVNMAYYSSIAGDDVNGASAIPGAGYLDRTIAHEMTHAVMSSNIEGFAGLYGCIKEGAAEVVHGIDDERKGKIQSLADSRSIAAQLTTSTSADTENVYAAGYVMFRFMAKQSGYSATDSLKHFMTSLAEGQGSMTKERIDAAVSAATRGKYGSFDDMKTALAAAEAVCGSGTEFLKKYCDIDLENSDTGAIYGHDAGSSREPRTAESVVPEAGSTKFWTNPTDRISVINGLRVDWDDAYGYVKIDPGLTFQVGTKANQALKVAFSHIDAQALGVQDKDGRNIKFTSQAKASDALFMLDNALERALNQMTTIGAIQSRLEYTAANLVTAAENVTNAESVIRDADMAKEMTEYSKNNVLLQAAQSMLAQANSNSSQVLGLLQ